MRAIENNDDLDAALADGKYTSVGAYPVYFIAQDGGVLSHEAVVEERELIRDAIDEGWDAQWCVIGCEINWDNHDLRCDHTGKQIDTAYVD
jgi:hypothetical protein